MHIPDGYLSPSTCAVLTGAAAPFLYVATRRTRRLLAGRLVPLLAVLAAFSFVVMMLNVPLPGGTSGHAVGATLAAVLLGPWAAMLVIATALAIQALFFGDGGILALGANVLNMAVAMPLVASGVYRLLGGPGAPPRRRLIAAATAGYVAMNVAALLTAVEFGLQPLLFRAPDGAPLYAPYGLEVALPVMMVGHLLVAGPAEGLITALALSYLARTSPELLALAAGPAPRRASRPALRLRWLWLGVAVLVVLAPLGLLATGTAWGEWDPTNPADWPLPAVPAGLQALSGLWQAPLPGYALPALGDDPAGRATGYVASALVGVALLALTGLGVGRLAARDADAQPAPRPTAGPEGPGPVARRARERGRGRDRGQDRGQDPEGDDE